jgi:hypothetical protein
MVHSILGFLLFFSLFFLYLQSDQTGWASQDLEIATGVQYQRFPSVHAVYNIFTDLYFIFLPQDLIIDF